MEEKDQTEIVAPPVLPPQINSESIQPESINTYIETSSEIIDENTVSSSQSSFVVDAPQAPQPAVDIQAPVIPSFLSQTPVETTFEENVTSPFQLEDGTSVVSDTMQHSSDSIDNIANAPIIPVVETNETVSDQLSSPQLTEPDGEEARQDVLDSPLNVDSPQNNLTENSIDGQENIPAPKPIAAPPKDAMAGDLVAELDKDDSAGTGSSSSGENATQNGEQKPSNEDKIPEKINYNSNSFLKELFANGNECITAPGGSYVISDATRSMLALFSNGRYFVAETHKYDGPPLLFVTDTKRRRLQIGQPEYVPLSVINNIYEYAAKVNTRTATESDAESQEQAKMQRHFVTIVTKAAASHVSDIHIVVADHTTVLFRTNGLMQVEFEYNKEWGESFVRAAFASADISDANYAQNEYQAAQKVGKTALRGSGGKLLLPRNVQGIRLQFNPIAFGTRYVVMRMLYDEDDSDTAGDLSVLGFEPHEVEIFYRLRAIPTGIVVVAGPTGSGKSTTLQRNMISMLQERNYELNLITVEDPPEYPIPGARQMPVTNAATEELKDREFTKALAASLRSDPDALMIGEVRTLAAADLAFRGALSGHNVWTTLHANSAPAILMRLKDMGVEDFKLQDPSIMKGLLSQRLFRKICPYCRIRAKDKLDNPAVKRLHQAFGDIGVEMSYLRGPGCKECEFRGVKGRTVVGEFVLPDSTFLDLMLRGETNKALDYWVTELNGRTLKEAAQSRMLKGIIDIEEVERWTGLFNDA